MSDLNALTLAEARDKLVAKEITSVELTEACLAAIEGSDSLNAFVHKTPEMALDQARAADQRLAKGSAQDPAPALCGLPLGIKDLFCTKGVPSQAASAILKGFKPEYESTVSQNLLDAGAVMLGKLNMDEFAMGSSNETSVYGDTVNPWKVDDRRLTPGGSSGGSAGAVAADLCLAATGTDTGGSIRQPAALCGITGLKPTYGRVSRWGMIAFASSLDQGGPMARTAEDCAIMLSCMASFDDKDSTCIDREVPDYSATLGQDIKGLRIGVPSEYFSEGLDPGTEKAVRAALAEFEAQGAGLVEISLPNTGLSVPAYYVIAPAEASANLSRFDGVKYGYRCEDPKDLQDLYSRTRAEGFGEEVQRRILIGTYCLSAGYYEAYYGKAQQVRKLIQQDFEKAFESVDVIMGPTCPSPAFKFGSKGDDPVAMYLEDIYTIATNLAGLPGMSVPCGMVDDKPVGLQIIGNYFAEARMLNVAHQYQQATDWHDLAPQGVAS